MCTALMSVIPPAIDGSVHAYGLNVNRERSASTRERSSVMWIARTGVTRGTSVSSEKRTVTLAMVESALPTLFETRTQYLAELELGGVV